MSKNLTKTVPSPTLASGVIENVIIRGDLSKLTDEQRVNYYMALCHSLDLNPMTKPFEYLELNRRLVLYANKACTEQLRQRDGISIEDIKTDIKDDYIRVIAKARNRDGRTDVSSAVVSLVGLKGADRANAEMKCETKAKRRVTLSLAGLGMLDETEVETIPDARKVTAEDVMSGEVEMPEYTIPFGKFKDSKIEDIDVTDLKNYIRWIREKAESQNKTIEGQVKEFLDNASAYLESLVLEADFKTAMAKAD